MFWGNRRKFDAEAVAQKLRERMDSKTADHDEYVKLARAEIVSMLKEHGGPCYAFELFRELPFYLTLKDFAEALSRLVSEGVVASDEEDRKTHSVFGELGDKITLAPRKRCWLSFFGI